MLRGFVYVGTCSLARGGQDGGGWREGHGEPITTGAALVSGTQWKQETGAGFVPRHQGRMTIASEYGRRTRVGGGKGRREAAERQRDEREDG
jgi:hypothetical protein